MTKPIEIKRLPTGIHIKWSDGTAFDIPSRLLRESCPCASCREKHGSLSHEKPLGSNKKKAALKIVESSSDEELRIDRIWPIGNYALGILWGDGHQTGIYTYNLLRELETALPANAAGSGSATPR
ncbi:MAG: DUF971 domain-containing protein [Deltaproteobacteria bacterium]|nr:DUF971 domain-containing protein [Deltaproteobacteria bacterium]